MLAQVLVGEPGESGAGQRIELDPALGLDLSLHCSLRCLLRQDDGNGLAFGERRLGVAIAIVFW
jgi:hypothetical protein